MTMKVRALMLAGLAYSFAGAANAASYMDVGSYTNTVAITDPPTAFTLLPDPTYTFAPFDSTLGTFESATVAWTAGFTFTGTIGPGGGGFGGNFSGSFGVNGTFYAGGNVNGGGGGDPGPLVVEGPFNGTGSQTWPPDDGSGILQLFTGTAPITFTWGTGDVTDADFFPNNVTGMLTGSDSVTVTYVYTPTAVPELSTWAMLGLGFAGLAGAAALQGRRKDGRLAA